MTLAGYLFLIGFWGMVLGLNIFCYVKLMKKNGKSPSA